MIAIYAVLGAVILLSLGTTIWFGVSSVEKKDERPVS